MKMPNRGKGKIKLEIQLLCSVLASSPLLLNKDMNVEKTANLSFPV